MTNMNFIPDHSFISMLLLSSTIFFLLISSQKAWAHVVVKKPSPNCQKQCGDISIEYPFGIGTNCYRDNSYSIICENSSINSFKPFLEYNNHEVLNISVQESTVKFNSPVLSSCSSRSTVDLSNVPFSFSGILNRFTAVGCDNIALLKNDKTIVGGCMSYCNNGPLNGSQQGAVGCYGLYCCQTEIPSSLKVLNVSFQGTETGDKDCNYACIVEQKYLETKLEQNIAVLKAVGYVPALLEWIILADGQEINGTCNGEFDGDLCGSNAHCSISTNTSSSQGYVCVCPKGYEGNPYLECRGNFSL